MSTDIPRTAQWNGGSRRPATPLPKAQLSAEANESDKLDNDQFEKQAAAFLKPTAARPALIAVEEVDYLRQTLTLGGSRLGELVRLTGKRLDFWMEQKTSSAPFDPLTPGERAKAQTFFKKYGVRLADEKPVAPPNPLRAPESEKAPAPAGAPSPAATKPAAAAESKPAPAADPAAVSGSKGALPPPASADIEFVLEHGYRCQVHVQAPSWSGVLDQVNQISERLVKMKAKPASPAPVAAAAAQAGTASAPPVCKYHGAMKASKKPGGWFCPKKMTNGEYCDQKVEGPA